MYPVEPFRVWQYAVSSIPVVDGQWINFVLYFDSGRTGLDGSVTLWTENSQGIMTMGTSVYGFNSTLDYQSTGVWAGQYIANGQNTGAPTEFHEDTIQASTNFPIDIAPPAIQVYTTYAEST